MARKKAKPYEEKKSDAAGGMRWLLTYADMITLLMVFFIILYSMSSVNPTKFEELRRPLPAPSTAAPSASSRRAASAARASSRASLPGSRCRATGEAGTQAPAGSRCCAPRRSRRCRTSSSPGWSRSSPRRTDSPSPWSPTFISASASAALNPDAMPVLQQVADFLGQIPNSVVVEGHTDNISPDAVKWPGGNWQLSAERGVAVLQTLEDYGIPSERLSSSAYGSTRPVQSNDTAEGRSLQPAR